jgi:ubiquitin-conjugating enzyme E2 G1
VLCISILHEPGVDQYGYEDAGERWLPVHTLESIVRLHVHPYRAECPEPRADVIVRVCWQILSVISMFSADVPDTNSPANVDAAKQVREDFPNYKKKVRRLVRQSAEDAYE